MFKKILSLFVVFFASLVLSGCDNNGKKFEGIWAEKGEYDTYQVFKIEDKGDHFKVTRLDAENGKLVSKNEYTMHSKDKDTIATDDMFDMIYNEENNTIYDGDMHLKKVKDADVPDLIKKLEESNYKLHHMKW
ncbi:hypothetical protein HGT73_05220 [Rosenbergiella australiborealis]|uniref:Lipoprotein n=1 Tax=Rosenbergiella australiborealis TaxID=1544696 RepID=A0ABS5T349_9GAMM|nr:hypothetical protein [Rosenbergiella australiborealis]MBT0726787.1 hypothetical protein [Rosenbergiella australiborealis]